MRKRVGLFNGAGKNLAGNDLGGGKTDRRVRNGPLGGLPETGSILQFPRGKHKFSARRLARADGDRNDPLSRHFGGMGQRGARVVALKLRIGSQQFGFRNPFRQVVGLRPRLSPIRGCSTILSTVLRVLVGPFRRLLFLLQVHIEEREHCLVGSLQIVAAEAVAGAFED
jgi:hypothetical protein